MKTSFVAGLFGALLLCTYVALAGATKVYRECALSSLDRRMGGNATPAAVCLFDPYCVSLALSESSYTHPNRATLAAQHAWSIRTCVPRNLNLNPIPNPYTPIPIRTAVSYMSGADVKVYIANYESEADLVVYKASYESQASRNDGMCVCVRGGGMDGGPWGRLD